MFIVHVFGKSNELSAINGLNSSKHSGFDRFWCESLIRADPASLIRAVEKVMKTSVPSLGRGFVGACLPVVADAVGDH